MRILGLDVGDRRVGVAISDPLNKIAISLEVIERKDLRKDLEYIKNIIDKNGVGKVIVGLPLNMKGLATKKTEDVKGFIEELKKTVDIPVETYDERFTTLQSEKFLIKADVSRKKRRAVVDKIAAQLILQSFLDSINMLSTDVSDNIF